MRLKELPQKTKSGLANSLGLAPARITEMINGNRTIHTTEVEPMAHYLEWPVSSVLAMINNPKASISDMHSMSPNTDLIDEATEIYASLSVENKRLATTLLKGIMEEQKKKKSEA